MDEQLGLFGQTKPLRPKGQKDEQLALFSGADLFAHVGGVMALPAEVTKDVLVLQGPETVEDPSLPLPEPPTLRVLVATQETQKYRESDFSFVPTGELVTFAMECAADRDDVDGRCGCRRSLAGVKTRKAITTFMVAEVEMTFLQYYRAVLRHWGSIWTHDIKAGVFELLRLAYTYPIGTVLEKRGAVIQPRRIWKPGDRVELTHHTIWRKGRAAGGAANKGDRGRIFGYTALDGLAVEIEMSFRWGKANRIGDVTMDNIRAVED